MSQPDIRKGNLKSYTIGFVLSVVLTVIPYLIVVNKSLEGWTLLFALLAFAVAQLFVQLQFFIHLGRESGPRWNLIIFLFMLLVLLIVVGGSLWIMHNLNYHMMAPEHVDQYLMEEEGIHHH